jgi:flagellar hook-length control protein FliK
VVTATPVNKFADFGLQTAFDQLTKTVPVAKKGGSPASSEPAAGTATGTTDNSTKQALGEGPGRIRGIPFTGIPPLMVSRPSAMLSSGNAEGTVEHAGVTPAGQSAGQNAGTNAVTSSGRPLTAAKGSAVPPPFTTGLSANASILPTRDPAVTEAPGKAPHHGSGADFLQSIDTSATALLHTSNAGSGNTATVALQATVRAATPPMGMLADQVAVRIDRAIETGGDRFTIQLKPAALGQVEVDLKIAHDGRVSAVISADRADTLDLLQRDSRVLEQALRNAGLHTDSGSLSFSLNGGKYGAAQQETSSGIATHPDPATDSNPIIDVIAGAALLRDGSIDIRV